MILLKRGLSVAAIALAAIAALTQPSRTETCNRQTFESTNYIICDAKADGTGLHLFWKNSDDEPYRNFSKIADAAASRGETLVFALNAGMYQPDFSPMGLYVENGRELRPASKTTPVRGSGPVPNFYKKPNGIFYLGDKGAEILPTGRFLKQRSSRNWPPSPGRCWLSATGSIRFSSSAQPTRPGAAVSAFAVAARSDLRSAKTRSISTISQNCFETISNAPMPCFWMAAAVQASTFQRWDGMMSRGTAVTARSSG